MTETNRHTGRSALALEHRFPGILGRLPRLVFTNLPTPVRPLERLAEGRGPASLWVKCDDASGPLYGGNKPRKLEFLLAEARRRGRSTVMTFGGIGTNHGLATTICARAAGMHAILILVPQPVTEHVRRNLLLDRAYGAELHLALSVPAAVRVAARMIARSLIAGRRPYVIPTGGSSPRGTIGFVNAGLELAEQVRAGELPEPDFIFIPVGSGGTHAGLVLGLRLAELRSRVVGVLVTDVLPPTPRRLAALANRALRLLRRCHGDVPPLEVTASDFTLLHGHLGAGYGAPSEEAVHAQRLIAEREGIRLETTYSAKCLAGLLKSSADGAYRGKHLLLWNTYSSVDPTRTLPALPDFHQLPVPFHRFFR